MQKQKYSLTFLRRKNEKIDCFHSFDRGRELENKKRHQKMKQQKSLYIISEKVLRELYIKKFLVNQ